MGGMQSDYNKFSLPTPKNLLADCLVSRNLNRDSVKVWITHANSAVIAVVCCQLASITVTHQEALSSRIKCLSQRSNEPGHTVKIRSQEAFARHLKHSSYDEKSETCL